MRYAPPEEPLEVTGIGSDGSDTENEDRICAVCEIQIERDEFTEGPHEEIWCWDCSLYCEKCEVGMLNDDADKCKATYGMFYCNG